jgi:SSS family solute:Na+ symporter
MLSTLELPLKIVLPFAVMIVCSLITRRNDTASLDLYYAKMKTPVDPDASVDQRNLESAFADYAPFEQRKVFPNSDVEIEKPSFMDIAGLVLTVTACLGVIALAVWVASIGA